MISRIEELQLLEDALNEDYAREDELTALCAQGRRSWEDFDALQGDIRQKIRMIEYLTRMSDQEYAATGGEVDA